MIFTVLGSSGFIGSALTNYLRKKGHTVETPLRGMTTLAEKNLGHVIYAIGMTGNFRLHLENTIEAHVNVLQKFFKDNFFESWLYLSSTRVYAQNGEKTKETSPITILPNADTIYDLSKLLGEAMCLSHENSKVRVARLSNVYGHGQSISTFLGSVLDDLKKTRKSFIQESPDSSKDYVSIDDVCEILELIALRGRERIYNVASGHVITHSVLAQTIRAAGYDISFSDMGATRIFPIINIDRILEEFKITPRIILNDLPKLIKA